MLVARTCQVSLELRIFSKILALSKCCPFYTSRKILPSLLQMGLAEARLSQSPGRRAAWFHSPCLGSAFQPSRQISLDADYHACLPSPELDVQRFPKYLISDETGVSFDS